MYGSQFIAASWQRGTLGMLIPLIQQAIADNPGVSGLPAALAVAHLEAGADDEARRVLEQGRDPNIALDGAWLTETTMLAEVAVECHVADAASFLFESLAPWSHQVSATGMTVEGPVSHYLGGLSSVLGRYDEAERFFTDAAAWCDRAGAACFAARTDLWRGRTLAERDAPGDGERAADLLTRARSVAAANGYGGIERRAEAALRRL